MGADNTKKDFDFFDDDFEVVYEDDLSHFLDLSDPEDEDDLTDYVDMQNHRLKNESVYNEDTRRNKDKPSKASKKNAAGNDRALNPENKNKIQKPKKKRNFHLPNVMSPVKKTAQAGGKAIGKLLQTFFRTASLLLIIAIMALTGVNFWKGHSVYGSLNTAAADKNYALAVFLSVGICLLLFELISFFWTMTSQKYKDGRSVRSLDTGRGLASFVIIYACSLLSSLVHPVIPESPSALAGLKGAISLFGSLNHTLLLICAAGVTICLIRKFIVR